MREIQREQNTISRSNSDISTIQLKSADELSKLREKLKDYQSLVNNNKSLSNRIAQVIF